MNAHFGLALKDWRHRRRLSQMDLGLSANVSARHISFLETGRARPSRMMVLMLCDELDIPRNDRNQMLMAAGLAPAYQSRDRNDTDLAPALEALDWMLERHDPYPAIAMDRHWNLIRLNGTSKFLMGALGLKQGDSIIEAFLTQPSLKETIENYQEVAGHLRQRLKTELTHYGTDPILEEAIETLNGVCKDEGETNGILPAFIPAIYKFNGNQFSFFSTFAQFGTVEDIALADIKIEMMFPANPQTKNLLLAMKGQAD